MKKLIALLLLTIFICPVAMASDLSTEQVINNTFRNDSIADGRSTITSGGTPEQVSSTSTAYGTITLCAETTNTGVMTIGGSAMDGRIETRTGVPLTAGACFTLQSNGDLDQIYFDGTVTGDGVTYAYTY